MTDARATRAHPVVPQGQDRRTGDRARSPLPASPAGSPPVDRSTGDHAAVRAADVASHYDELDAFYRMLWGEHVHHGLWVTGRETVAQAVVQLLERVATAVQVEQGDRVCDVGCGYGATGRWLWERFEAAVTGYTLSAAQHSHALRLAPAGQTYHLADWLENGEPADSFDTVIAVESTEHMPDRGHFAREAFRIAKPGGRIAIGAWLATPDPAPWHARHLLEPICREGMLPAPLPTETEWIATLLDAGFRRIRSERLGRSVRRTWSRIARRVLTQLTRSAGWAYLLDRRNRHRRFTLTVFRLWLAYRVHAMDYAIIAATKPGPRHEHEGAE